jgi:2,3-bisphosphoglycerate-dependent phosphoglycerate mutase
MMSKLIMLRHGESEWNKLDLFTGWVDVPLSTKGIDESLRAGILIKDIPIDIIITSTLMRAQMTALLAMSCHSSGKVPVILHNEGDKFEGWSKIHGEAAAKQVIPVVRSWELNERMYGDLQGLNKAETRQKYGEEQVQIWRRSYDTAPSNGESLAMTAERSIPYFKEKIFPFLQEGFNVLVSAHGNSLRSVIMYLDGLTKEEVIKLEIATGVPIIYDFANGAFHKETQI